MVGVLRKNVVHHGWSTMKNKKKHWLKRLKAFPKKRSLDQNINTSKSHICNSFFENDISNTTLVHTFQWTSSEFFLFQSQSLKVNKNWQKKTTHFTIQFRSKNITYFIAGGAEKFPWAAHCLGLVKCFTIFHLNNNFWKFSYLDAFINSFETLKFSR